MFRELVITVHSQTSENVGGDGPPPPLSSLVILPLLPRRHPRAGGHFRWKRGNKRGRGRRLGLIVDGREVW